MHPEKEKILKKLTEKEIHDRLYGKIRGIGQKISMRNVIKKSESSAMESPKEELASVKAELVKVRSAQQHSFYHKARAYYTKNINWRPIAFIGACLLILTVIIISFILIKMPAQKYSASPEASIASTAKGQAKPYTIQVAVYDKKDMASLLMNSLKKEGFDAFIAESVSSKGNTRYKVYVGEYQTSNEAVAQETLEKIKSKDQFRDAFIRYK